MLAAMQHDAADELHVEVPHVQHTAAALADYGEGLRQEVVEGLASAEPKPEFGGLPAELFVGELLDLRLFCVDRGDQRAQTLQVTLVLRADDLREESINNHSGRISSGYLPIVQHVAAVSGWNAASIGANCG